MRTLLAVLLLGPCSLVWAGIITLNTTTCVGCVEEGGDGGGGEDPGGDNGGGDPGETPSWLKDYNGRTPTLYACNSDTGDGSGSSEENSMDMTTALQVAQAGDIVGLCPGVIEKVRVGENTALTPAMNPDNSGTAENPIIFVGKRNPILDPSNRTELRNGETVTSQGNARPTIGVDSRNYIWWENFYVDVANSAVHSGTGPMSINNTDGSRAEHFHIVGTPQDVQDNYCGGWLQGTRDVVIRNGLVEGFRAATDESSYSVNNAAFCLYDFQDSLIEYVTMRDNDIGIHSKGDPAYNEINARQIGRYNHIVRAYFTAHRFDDLQSDPSADDTPSEFYDNLIESSGAGFVLDPHAADSPRAILIHHNTILDAGNNTIALIADNPRGGVYLDVAAGRTFHNVHYTHNVHAGGTFQVARLYGATDQYLSQIISNGYVQDYNHAYGFTRWGEQDGNFATLSAWTADTTLDANSTTGDPEFTNPSVGDYRCTSVSCEGKGIRIERAGVQYLDYGDE